MIKAAYTFDWVDYPQVDRWHATPTALMGGVAMYAAGTLAILLLGPLAGGSAGMGVIWGGASLLFVVGLVDDLWGMGPAVKLTAQIGAAGLLVATGHRFGPEWPLWISGPVTLLWVIGITNAINLLDNMDGLAAGVAGIAATALTAFAVAGGALPAVLLGGTLAGMALSFLWFNAKPARIFMGDCGSLVLGYGVAALAVMGQGAVEVGPGVAVLASICALAVPILDTTLVTVTRMRAGRSVADGGQDHTSHRLVSAGLPEQASVGMLHGMGAAAGGIGLLALVLEPTLFYVACALGTVALGTLGIHLGRLDVRTAAHVGGDGAPGAPLDVQGGLEAWPKESISLIGDGLLVGGAFAAAHTLSGTGDAGGAPVVPLVEGLLLVGGAKLALFAAMGLYRRLWQHAGTLGVARIVGTALLAEGATAGGLALVYGPGALSGSLLTVDGLIVTVGLLGTRLGFRGLRRGVSLWKFRAAPSETTSNVLLYGVGERGRRALRALRDDEETDRVPVGFVDPDASTQGQMVQGLPVLGGSDACGDLCREHDVDEVIVATDAPGAEREASRQCAEAGVECQSFDVCLTPIRSEREAADRSGHGAPPAA
jgi:UDP-GlcNAc:undecaprenyl-phosphate GlcNAc-1-phosphate transferase